MWSSAFDSIQFDWFYFERLRRSSRLASHEERLKTDFGPNADFHMSRTKRIIIDNQSFKFVLMHDSASNVWISLDLSIFSNMAACRGGFEDEDKENSCMSCLNTTKYRCLRSTVNFHCATNDHFQKKTTKLQVGKLESLLRIAPVPCSKEAFEQGTQYSTHAVGEEDAFAVSGLKAPL